MKKALRPALALSLAIILFGAGFLCARLAAASASETPRAKQRLGRREMASPQAPKKDLLRALRDNPSGVVSGDIYVAVWAMDDTERSALFARIAGMPPGPRKGALLESVVRAWQERSPQAALESLGRLPPGYARQRMLDEGVRQWARKDPESAVLWVEGQAGAVSRGILDRYRVALVYEWAHGDPAAALAYARELPPLDYHPSRMNQAIHALAKSGNAALAAEAAQGTQEGEEQIPMGVIALGWASFDMPAALQWAAAFEDERRKNMAHNIIMNYGADDPRAVVEWFERLPPDDPLRADRGDFRNMFSAWAHFDAEAAAAWIGARPPSPERDQALGAFVGTLSESDPTAAMAWAQQGASEKTRADMRRVVMKNWIHTDAEGARAHLDAPNAFTPDEAARFRKELDKSAQ